MNKKVKFRRKWSFTGKRIKDSVIILEAVGMVLLIISALPMLFSYRAFVRQVDEKDNNISVNYCVMPASELQQKFALRDPASTLSLDNRAGFTAQLPEKLPERQIVRPQPVFSAEPLKQQPFVPLATSGDDRSSAYIAGTAAVELTPRSLPGSGKKIIISGSSGNRAAALDISSPLPQKYRSVIRIIRQGNLMRYETVVSCGNALLDRKVLAKFTALNPPAGTYFVLFPEVEKSMKNSTKAGGML